MALLRQIVGMISVFVVPLVLIFFHLMPRITRIEYRETTLFRFPNDTRNYSYLNTSYDGSWESGFLLQFSSFTDDPSEEEYEVVGIGEKEGVGARRERGLEYDFYRESCPRAEEIVREVVRGMYRARASVAPALVRLLFHDCFIEGCDASILLDPLDGMGSEKDSPPNDGLKGFSIIDTIKSELELVCPGIVSCADIVVLAGRAGIVEAGGPFHPLLTGRRDSLYAYRDIATEELPSPNADLPQTLAAFASKGFDERETVSLLGAHSIGVAYCKSFRNRLYNFNGTDKPDASVDAGFLDLLRASCKSTQEDAPTFSAPHAFPLSSPSPSASSAPFYHRRTSPSSAPSFSGSPSPLFEIKEEEHRDPSTAGPMHSSKSSGFSSKSAAPSGSLDHSLFSNNDDPAVNMQYREAGQDFGSVYYHRLLQRKGILYSDQQLMAGVRTGFWVRAYAADPYFFRKDFSRAMMKLSHLRVLTGSEGQVRRECSKVLGGEQHQTEAD